MGGILKPRLSERSGKVLHWEKESCGISGTAESAKFRVTFYADSIARIQLTRDDFFEDFSYSVIATPVSMALQIADSPETIRITTRKLTLLIRKDSLSFHFQTLQGQTINQDDEAFSTSWIGDQVTTYKKLQEGERFIGLGEKTGPLDRRGFGYTHWNTDNFGYTAGSDPLYCSTPFYIGIHHQLCYGIFFDNTHKTHVNFGASNDRFSSFSADAGEMNYYFMYDQSARAVISQYTHLTGRMEMPPLWSIGYQQCRYSYYPDKEVLSVANTFREKDIPADAIVFDIHYMEQYKIFTWSKKDFADPTALLAGLRDKGFHVIVMCDPGIKVEKDYKTYDDGIAHDVFIKYPDGTPYTGQVWPGWCHFPDFTRPATRQWWKDQFADYVAQGVSGFWNDMNEIATWGNMLPENVEMDFEGHRSTLRRGRNIYGFQMARSTYEGTKALMKNRRPFNLTRSGFSGIQRYAAVWTGDNVAYDEHMMLGVRLVNSMGLTGIAFAGYDVGGFVGDASTRLFARWISIGAFSPFFRGHSMINSRDSEPWSYGEEVEQISRNYIRFRYQLLPYLYSLFFEASTNGMPVQRSLAIDYTHDARIYEHQYQHQYLFGPSLLVIPVESTKEFVRVYFPKGNSWYSLYNGQKYDGASEVIVDCPLYRLPLFVKSGAIIPMQPVVSNTSQSVDLFIVHLYAGEIDNSFLYYEDDGISFDYQSGVCAKRMLRYEAGEKRLVFERVEGTYSSGWKSIRLVFHGFGSLNTVEINDKSMDVHSGINSFFAGLEKYDPIKDPEPAPEENVMWVEFPYSPDRLSVDW
ncbi:MAG: glycoside hydrolase family 31 protein [Bacteroidota bacterium]|nr:glycoside hydrolase family 31 protein [Bacteroidota bacterium]